MSLVSTAKWLLKAGPISRSEKLVSTGVVYGLNYLAKKANDRGDFHEANHNMVAILAGISVHEHQGQCVIPSDRLLNQAEGVSLAAKLHDNRALEEAGPGFYL